VTVEMDDLPPVEQFVGERWALDLVGAARQLFDAGVHGLLRAEPDMVLAFRHRDVRALAVAPAAGNTPVEVLMRRATEAGAPPDSGMAPIISNQVFTFNPPLHAEARRVLTRQMMPANTPRFAPLVERLLDEILADLAGRQAFDACAEFAQRLAARFWGELIGLSRGEQEEMQGLMEVVSTVFLADMLFDQYVELDQGVRRYMELVTSSVERAMSDRGGAQLDPLGIELLEEMERDLAEIDVPGAPETVGFMAAGNFFDGFHTLGVGIANALCLLLGHPASYERVRADCRLASAAYDEGTRLAAPLTLTTRYTLNEIEHDGVRLPPNTRVAMHWAGANLDPEAFDDPGTYRLDRPGRGLMTFGGGPHLCPGRNISRFVGEIALRRLVHRPERLMLTAGGADWIEGASAAQLRSCIVQSR